MTEHIIAQCRWAADPVETGSQRVYTHTLLTWCIPWPSPAALHTSCELTQHHRACRCSLVPSHLTYSSLFFNSPFLAATPEQTRAARWQRQAWHFRYGHRKPQMRVTSQSALLQRAAGSERDGAQIKRWAHVDGKRKFPTKTQSLKAFKTGEDKWGSMHETVHASFIGCRDGCSTSRI